MNDRILSAKEYLEQLQVLDTNIYQNLERLDEIKSDAMFIKGIDYGKERVQCSVQGNKVCNDVTRYTALEEKINEEIEQFIDAKNRIISQIRNLRINRYIQILYKVYVQYKSIRIAAKEMKLSYPYVLELHTKALKNFEETYKNLYYIT